MTHRRHSARVVGSKRWKVLRIQALRRDGWACVRCGAVGRLEIDHILPVRTHPELAYALDNLQTLCPKCHASKTWDECGNKRIPGRQEWRDLLLTTFDRLQNA